MISIKKLKSRNNEAAYYARSCSLLLLLSFMLKYSSSDIFWNTLSTKFHVGWNNLNYSIHEFVTIPNETWEIVLCWMINNTSLIDRGTI
jgi:hypothetical protein